jgi:hypothetical protein
MAKITVNTGQNAYVYKEAIKVDIPARFINKDDILQIIAQAVADHLRTTVTIHEQGYQCFSLSPTQKPEAS